MVSSIKRVMVIVLLFMPCLSLGMPLGSEALVYGMDTEVALADASFIGNDRNLTIGNSTAFVGDVNGDGLDDLLVGALAKSSSPDDIDEVFLILGKASGWSNDTDIAMADASFIGEAKGDQMGSNIAGAGDVNGDGYDDILIGALLNDENGNNAGQAYLVLGRPGGWALDMSLADADASFLGEYPEDIAGISVDGAGDVNGDGFDDIIIGAYANDEAGPVTGQVYLILGKADGWQTDANLSQSDASFLGERMISWFGSRIAGAGDVNGDGFDDILIGAWNDDEGGGDPFDKKGAGQSYLILGKGDGWTMDVPITDIAAASFIGESAGDLAGFTIDGAGDLNGDGYDDIMIGAPSNDRGGGDSQSGTGAGGVFIIHGKTSGWSLDTNLSFADVVLTGERIYDSLGWSMGGSGDVDGDGLDDMVLGAIGNNETGNMAGQAYLVLGRSTWPSEMKVSDIADASFTGEAIADIAGYSVAMGGDLDHDGYDDIVISSPGNNETGDLTGQVYIVFPDRNSPPSSIASVTSYSDPGYSQPITDAIMDDTVYLELDATDGNSSRRDLALVTVKSNGSSPMGITLRLFETGPATGKYRGNYTISYRTDEDRRLLASTPGENVTAESAQDPARNSTIFVGYHQLTAIDLTVSNMAPDMGEVVNVTANLSNSGYKSLTDIKVDFMETWAQDPGNTTVFATRTVDLDMGEELEIDVDWDTAGKAGLYHLKVMLDPLDVVREADEDDNGAAVDVTVGTPAELDVSVERSRYERGEVALVLLHNSKGPFETGLQVLFPNGTALYDEVLQPDANGDIGFGFILQLQFPLGTYRVIASYNQSLRETTFEVVNEPPTISSPADIQYLPGGTGNTIVWAGADQNPTQFSVLRDGGMVKGGAWNGSDIQVSVDGLPPGMYNYTLELVDLPGNRVNDTVKVTVLERPVDQPPAVLIERPIMNATISGTVNILGTASDADGQVVRVDISIDSGPAMVANGTSVWSYGLDTTAYPDGKHTIHARATDDMGLQTTAKVDVNIDNRPNTVPTVLITSPVPGAKVSMMITIRGTAYDLDSDNITVHVRVDDGPWLKAVGDKDWHLDWATGEVANGNHTVTAKAVDDRGAWSEATLVVVVVNKKVDRRTHVDDAMVSVPIIPSMAAVTAVGAIGIAFAMTDVGRWKFFNLLFLAGYTKRRDEKVLDNFLRGIILGLIIRDPGIRPIDVSEDIEGEYTRSLIYYHIHELIKFGFTYMVQRDRRGRIVKTWRGENGRMMVSDDASGTVKEFDLTVRASNLEGMSLHLYPSSAAAPKKQISMRRKQRFLVYKHIAENPGSSLKEIAGSLDMLRQGVSYHLKELQKDGLLIIGTQGRSKYYFIDKGKQVDLRGNVGRTSVDAGDRYAPSGSD